MALTTGPWWRCADMAGLRMRVGVNGDCPQMPEPWGLLDLCLELHVVNDRIVIL